MKPPATTNMRDTAKAAISERGTAHDPVTGEVVEQDTAQAVMDEQSANDALGIMGSDGEFLIPDQFKPEIIKQVTVPLLKWEIGKPIYALVKEPIYQAHPVPGQTMQPPHLAQVMGAQGQLRLIIVGAVLKSEFERNYPDGSYVGKWFAMKKIAPTQSVADDGTVTAKRYATYQIIEIRDPRAPSSVAAIKAA